MTTGKEKAQPLSAIRGMNDVFPEEARRFRFLEETARQLFALYGYGELRTPILEPTELFARSVGDASDVVVSKQMYTFIDPGERSNTLRPEGTAGAVRALVENGLLKREPQAKLFYIGPMFRYEKPQKGRLRQFNQIGVEFFGVAHPAADAEVIAMSDALLRRVGFTQVQTRVNNIGCRDCRRAYNDRLREAILGGQAGGSGIKPADGTPPSDEFHAAGTVAGQLAAEEARNAPAAVLQWCEQCVRRAELNPMRVFDCKVETCKSLVASLPKISDYVCDACRAHFAEVLRLLDAARIPYEADPDLVRGFDYYTRTVFEIVQEDGLGSQNAVVGGGRYDYLVEELGGPPTPAAGMGLGVERLLLAMERLGLNPPAEPAPDYYVLALDDSALPVAFDLVQRGRSSGVNIAFDCQPRKMKAGFKAAEKAGARFMLIIGGDEAARGVAQRKNLQTGEQVEVPLAEAL